MRCHTGVFNLLYGGMPTSVTNAYKCTNKLHCITKGPITLEHSPIHGSPRPMNARQEPMKKDPVNDTLSEDTDCDECANH